MHSINFLLSYFLERKSSQMGHFGHVPQVNLLAWYGKTKPNTKSTHSPIKRNVLQHKKLKPGLVASYDIWPGNEGGLFWFWHFKNLRANGTRTLSVYLFGICTLKRLITPVMKLQTTNLRHGYHKHATAN